MKFSYMILAVILCGTPLVVVADDTPPAIVRTSIFSTSLDWEAITGLRLKEFRIGFTGNLKSISKGTELYYLDGFPCHGQSDRVRTWISKKDKPDNDIRISCLTKPEVIYFAWNDTARNGGQYKTIGILDCPVSGERDLTIDLSKCTTGKKWEEFK